MSSANLRRSPEVVEQHQSVQEALVEVAENSFFAFVDPIDGEALADAVAAAPSWLEASVTFTGAFGGTMRIVVAEPLALELFASFLGLEPGEAADDARLFDLVGEFGNMVCGSWLTRSCQRRRFDLQHPVVVRQVVVEPPADGEGLSLALNGQPVFVRLMFAEA
jgi:CheY-specific phosphatase CheX